MANEPFAETLDQSSPSISDPSLGKLPSFSRLNAKAPEFVPTRTAPLQRIFLPQAPPSPPPPPGVVHVYPAARTFLPIHATAFQQQNRHHLHHIQPPSVHYHHHQHYSNGAAAGFSSEQEAVVPPAQQSQVDAPDQRISSRSALSHDSNQKILNQVEYYFSDLNLATTDHLMKFINKDPEGYVPLSVVLSFKKIKALVSGNSQLAAILRNSAKLVVSEDGKKVKRLHPLTRTNLEEMQTRIVVAENLPDDHCHQNLVKVFSAVGSVKTIRTCQPQPTNAGASSAPKSGKADGMLFSSKLHAFVEYESAELAEKAVTELNNAGNWRRGLKVRLLLRRAAKHGLTHCKEHEFEGNCEEEANFATDMQLNENPSEELSRQCDARLHDHTGENIANDKEAGQVKGRNSGRGKGKGRGQNQNQNQNHSNNRGNHIGSSARNSLINDDHKQPPGPRMPDGTRGFAMGRGKPV